MYCDSLLSRDYGTHYPNLEKIWKFWKTRIYAARCIVVGHSIALKVALRRGMPVLKTKNNDVKVNRRTLR